MDLSPLPDDDFDLSAVNQSDWLSTPPFWSLSPELADTPTAASKETPETETTSDTPFQENLADKTNLSDFMPGAYIYPLDFTTTERGVTPHLLFFFSSLSSDSKSGVFVVFRPRHHPHHQILCTSPSLSYLLDPSGLSFQTNSGSQENTLALAQPPSAATLHLGPMSTPSNIILPPPAQPTNTQNLPVQNCLMANPAPQMPLRSTQNAPKFDGKTPALLPCFLEDVNILGTVAGITDLEKICATIRYADLEEAEGWELLDEVATNPPDWANFARAVKKLYPSCKGANRYCRADIQYLVQEFQAKPMHTLEDLSEYQRKFLKIARILINSRKLSDLDQDALFLSGLPADLETQVPCSSPNPLIILPTLILLPISLRPLNSSLPVLPSTLF